jgi:phosphonate transport system substrate-binding protein
MKFAKVILISMMILSLSACLKDEKYSSINFSDTIAIPKAIQNDNKEILRVAVAAMISPKETFTYYRQLLSYIGTKLGQKTILVQRKTYKEINELFPKNEIDLAFICSGPYALEQEKYMFQALATPVVRGSPFYQSYLIVNKNSNIETLSDLRHRTFAYSDPDSNTGSLVPKYWLHELGERSKTFFSSTNYTYSHDNSILSVAKSLVDGAAVDGHKWEYFQSKNNPYTSQTRVIKKSEKFGSPPLVAALGLPDRLKKEIQDIILMMHEDPKGLEILNNLLIDRFLKPKEEWYQPIWKMRQIMKGA